MIQTERSVTGELPTVVIIGGGYSGAVLAWHLHQAAPHRYNIVIVEPRDELGRGLAYDSHDPAHRINVPALKMNLDFDEEGHFEQWLIASGYPARDPAGKVKGALYPARAAFGDYVSAHVKQLGRAVTHIRTKACAVVPEQDGYRVVCANGDNIRADVAVLAVCHTPPQVPASLASLRGRSRFIANPWQSDALRGIASKHRVLIVGTGLTMADIVASLDSQGHRGNITAVSRRGLRSQPHATLQMEPFGDFLQNPERTTLALLRRVRRAIAEASKDGLTWHPVLDQLRLQGTSIWRALPLHERAKLVHHLRPFWDTHRFRMAPQIDNVIRRRISEGSLAIRAASIRASKMQDRDFAIDLSPRRRRIRERQTFDAIVVATGPAHGAVLETDPLLRQIRDAGLARSDPLNLGIDVDLQSRAIGCDGHVSGTLFVAGPLARGTFGELMGAPDLARHARNIAQHIAQYHNKAATELCLCVGKRPARKGPRCGKCLDPRHHD